MKTMFNFLIVIACLATATAYADTIKKIDFETIDKGVYSHYEENNKQHIIEINDQNEW